MMTRCQCGATYFFPTVCPCGGRSVEDVKIAFDTTLRRPGCAIVQAGFGCDPQVSHYFNSDTWLLVPTDDMRVFKATPEQLQALVRMADEAISVDS